MSIVRNARQRLGEWLLGRGRGAQSLKARTPAGLTLWPRFYDDQPMRWMAQDLDSYASEGFEANSLIYSAVMYKVRAQQSAPLRAYTGSLERPEALPAEHPLAGLLARPNDFQSWTEFHGLQTVFLNLTGNAYTYLERPRPGALPERLLPLRPDWVYHVPGGGNGLLGYIFAPAGLGVAEPQPLLPEDVIHVKLPNPRDPLSGLGPGLSPLAAAAMSSDVDNIASRFLRGFFRGGAMPVGILRYPASLQPQEMDEIRERWRDKYGGATNWLDVAVLSDAGEYQRIGMTFDEMGFGELDQRNETRILGPLGVPPILIGARSGLERSTYSNSEEARQAFWLDTFRPEMSLHEGEYQYVLSQEDGAFVAFDYSGVPALQQSLPPLVEAAYRLWSMGYPAAVATAALGLDLPMVPGADVAYAPMSLLPVGRWAPEGDTGPATQEGAEKGYPGQSGLSLRKAATPAPDPFPGTGLAFSRRIGAGLGGPHGPGGGRAAGGRPSGGAGDAARGVPGGRGPQGDARHHLDRRARGGDPER